MIPKLLNTLLILLLASSLQTDARRSRIDLPISNAAEAPASDNIATASDVEPTEVKVEAPVSDTVAPTSTAALYGVPLADSPNAIAEIEEECDTDMIGFEIVTG